jgi:hypothetical protein
MSANPPESPKKEEEVKVPEETESLILELAEDISWDWDGL